MPDHLYACKDTTVNFKAQHVPVDAGWPSGKPVWGELVNGSEVATNSYTFSTLSASTTDYKIVTAECGNTVTGKVLVLKVDLKSIEFTSDHGVMTDYTNNYAGAGGTVFEPRGWIKGGANNPITHTKDNKITANVTFCIQPSGVNFDLAGDGPIEALDFHTNGLVSSGSDQTIPVTSEEKLPLKIDRLVNQSITWVFSISNNPIISEDSGPHWIYVTWGNLGEDPTLLRVATVCEWAEDKTTEETIADTIWSNIITYTEFSGGGTNEEWQLLDPNTSGDCDNLAGCMKVAVEMTSITPAYVEKVHASTNAGTGNCLDQDLRVVSNRTQYLILDFYTNGVLHDWNAYEGCCKVAGYYYSFGLPENLKKQNDYEMLKALPCRQYWIIITNDVAPGAVSNWVQMIEAVLNEEQKP